MAAQVTGAPRPIPYRGADYSAHDAPFLQWWRDNMPRALFGEARDAYDATQDKRFWPYTTQTKES